MFGFFLHRVAGDRVTTRLNAVVDTLTTLRASSQQSREVTLHAIEVLNMELHKIDSVIQSAEAFLGQIK